MSPSPVWLLLAMLAACGSSGSQTCSWPAAYDPPASAPGECIAARYFVECTNAGGGGEECLSADRTQCPDSAKKVNGPYPSCKSLCNDDEYAMRCGSIGGGGESAPAGCRELPRDPSGIASVCCPCS